MGVDEAAPAIRVGLAVQPEADIDQDRGGEEGGDAFCGAASRAANGDDVARHEPRDAAERERPNPSGVNEGQRLAATGLREERDDRGDHE